MSEEEEVAAARKTEGIKVSRGVQFAVLLTKPLSSLPCLSSWVAILQLCVFVLLSSRLTLSTCCPTRSTAHLLQVRGADIPKPVKTWTQCGINVKVLEVLKKHGFERPLSIQAQV